MLKAKCTDGTWIFGLDKTNIQKLTAKQPILINLEDLGGEGRIIIMYSETLEDIKKELEEVLGPLPEPKEG
jgi:hypothetical protein